MSEPVGGVQMSIETGDASLVVVGDAGKAAHAIQRELRAAARDAGVAELLRVTLDLDKRGATVAVRLSIRYVGDTRSAGGRQAVERNLAAGDGSGASAASAVVRGRDDFDAQYLLQGRALVEWGGGRVGLENMRGGGVVRWMTFPLGGHSPKWAIG